MPFESEDSYRFPLRLCSSDIQKKYPLFLPHLSIHLPWKSIEEMSVLFSVPVPPRFPLPSGSEPVQFGYSPPWPPAGYMEVPCNNPSIWKIFFSIVSHLYSVMLPWLLFQGSPDIYMDIMQFSVFFLYRSMFPFSISDSILPHDLVL